MKENGASLLFSFKVRQTGIFISGSCLIISLPEEEDVYTFGRSVQVAENAPLELDMEFGSKLRLHL